MDALVDCKMALDSLKHHLSMSLFHHILNLRGLGTLSDKQNALEVTLSDCSAWDSSDFTAFSLTPGTLLPICEQAQTSLLIDEQPHGKRLQHSSVSSLLWREASEARRTAVLVLSL